MFLCCLFLWHSPFFSFTLALSRFLDYPVKIHLVTILNRTRPSLTYPGWAGTRIHFQQGNIRGINIFFTQTVSRLLSRIHLGVPGSFTHLTRAVKEVVDTSWGVKLKRFKYVLVECDWKAREVLIFSQVRKIVHHRIQISSMHSCYYFG